jgi:hypothetical protein
MRDVTFAAALCPAFCCTPAQSEVNAALNQ